MKVAIVNIGSILTGDLSTPFVDGDTIITADGLIEAVGNIGAANVEQCDVIIDANGTMAIPGLIDSHVHITFGDYTPRQKTVGFLESYVHGGVTTSISASEVHVPGRPKDVTGVKALAIAAAKCFQQYRPGGMRVHAGSLILEPGLTDADFAELKAAGIWMVKAGFGAFATPYEYAPLVALARRHGMISMVHTGGASIPGSSGIWADHLLRMQPDVSYHVNGGPIAMPDEDFPRLVNESDMALQICTAGNLRTTLLVSELLTRANRLERLLIATDTPTGSGIMPLGMLYTISHLASLGKMAPEIAIAAACGNNARVYRLNSGTIAHRRDADIVLIDSCMGGSKSDALSALRNGDIPAVGAVVTGGIPRFVGRSRNTPETMRRVRVAKSNVMQDFSGTAH
ncbi:MULTISPECIES: amidohydrolase family protein [unclassified Mesorhizobium]|uniref:amidohydrolase family protein n=1 Tax=unclassified Mesorhizobium TaxID=325217 RepID=UPI0024156971|nr:MULTISPECIES: amidohydrolase family protein [unclassified Mesorhizobium]MDG4890087.1 amidohydrolase family protein [Mesorhizobium sp. WSM4887]MDG4904229.1 amidohydrolase family protein [Mesorhizobium sp. WSM4962]MDG4909256.1 amidohydrolase family protein [Mesorhizobium sp. WSM4898]MDG4921880.1 amidohydrolase family protein [Mesorhizobium sp. WSM4989]